MLVPEFVLQPWQWDEDEDVTPNNRVLGVTVHITVIAMKFIITIFAFIFFSFFFMNRCIQVTELKMNTTYKV